MRVFTLGQTVTWGLTVTSDGTTLADLGGGNPTATVTLPDGTTAAAAVVRESVGMYAALLTSMQAGRHRIVWTGSGDNSGDLPYTDVADVWPADPRMIISLEDARAALNLPAASRVDDDEIRFFIAAATAVIEDKIGTVLLRTVTERRSGSHLMGLPLFQAASAITSVVEDGVTLPATGYCLDEHSILWRGSRMGAGRWSDAGVANVTIEYTSGSRVVDPAIVAATREAVRLQYQRSQLAERPAFGAVAEGGTADAPSYIPTGWGSVDEYLRPFKAGRMPGLT